MAAYVLDTSIAIPLRDGDRAVMQRLAEIEGTVMLSIITQVELEGGVYREPLYAGGRRARLDAILAALPVLDFDQASADAYRAILEAAGYSRRKILDRMIAAQALAHRATLVTSNAEDFGDVPGLTVLAW